MSAAWTPMDDLSTSDIQPWLRPTVEQVRNLVLTDMWLSAEPPDDQPIDPLIRILPPAAFLAAVSEGRLFDLGHLPNALIRKEAKRALALFGQGYIGHPFRETYAIYHTWENSGSLYVIDALDWHGWTDGAVPPGTFTVREAQPALVGGHGWLLLGSAAIVALDAAQQAYHGMVVRSPFGSGKHSDDELMCTVVDPVIAAMLLLATDGVAVDRIPAPEKLNKKRLKAGKLAIPPHWRVHTAGYVTALAATRRDRGEPGGGRHASPIPHLRRGHPRRLRDRTIWVRDALVNLKDPDTPLARAFYTLPGAS